MASVFISRFTDRDLNQTIRDALEWIKWTDIIAPGARVFIKPNFTYPFYKPGVTTSPQVIEAVVRAVVQRTPHITIGESDGGASAWRAEEAFTGHDIPRICHMYGAKAVNLSALPSEEVRTTIAGVEVRVKLTSLLLHEVDAFITMPVPKVHAMTGVSLGFKNQWGCIPDVMRLRYHPRFAHTVLGINRALRTGIAVFDGTYFLDRFGPMDGVPIPMNLILASDDPGAGSLACCEIMQVDPKRIGHLRLAMRAGMMPESVSAIRVNQPLNSFKTHRFVLRRTPISWVTRAVFRSTILTHIVYDSRFARPIHDLFYRIRGQPKDVRPQW